MQKLNCDVAIVGAGACGLSLGFYLSEIAPSLTIAIFDCEEEAGKKLARTGNGRCNLANACWNPNYYHSLSWPDEQTYNEFWQAFLADTHASVNERIQQFWQNVGVFLLDQDKWYYPRHLSAKQLRGQLLNRCLANGVQVNLGQTVCNLRKMQESFLFFTKSEQAQLEDYQVQAKYLVLATGGASQCQETAVKQLIDCLQAWHVSLVQWQPALVQLQTRPNYLRLTGLRLKIKAKLLLSPTTLVQEDGEILFAKYGISGIVSMILSNYYQQQKNHTYISRSCKSDLTQKEAKDLSRHLKKMQFLWPEQRKQTHKTYLLLDLLSELSDEKIEHFISTKYKQNVASTNLSKEQIAFLLSALLPSKLQAVIIEQLSMYCANETVLTLADLIYFLRNWPLLLKDTLGLKEAQVSLGGVALSEINPSNFALHSIKNCFVGGELLDLVGDCGGYNLMLAVWTALKIGDEISKKEQIS